MRLRRGLTVVSFALALSIAAPTAGAQSVLYASDGQNLLSIDKQTYAVTTIGPMPLELTTEHFHIGMTFDEAGALFSMSLDRLYTVDTATGATTEVGPHDTGWFLSEGAIAFHPTTGMGYVPNGGGIFNKLLRIDPSTGQGTTVGQLSTSEIDFNGLTFAPSGQLYGIDRKTDALWTIDHQNPGGPGTHQVGAGLGAGITLGATGGLTYDPKTGLFWGYATDTHALFTVDPNTGVGAVVKTFGASVPPLFALAAPPCTSIVEYGQGCAGSGGSVPTLALEPCDVQTGQPVQLVVADALGGAPALLVFGLTQGFTPMDAGCALLVQPLLAPIVALPLGGVGPGNGGAVLSAVMPAGLPTPFSFTMQVFVADGGGAASFANSRGLEVSVDV